MEKPVNVLEQYKYIAIIMFQYNIANLEMSKGVAAKVVISYPREEVSVIKWNWRKGPKYRQKHRIKIWATVADASLHHELLALEFKDALAH